MARWKKIRSLGRRLKKTSVPATRGSCGKTCRWWSGTTQAKSTLTLMMLRNSPVSWTCSMHTQIRMIFLQSKGLYWNVWRKTEEWVEIRTEEVWSCFKRTNQHSAHGDHVTGTFSAVLGHLPCPSSLEDSYHRPCTKETFPKSTEWLLPYCPHFHPFQVYGETASSKTQCSSHTPRTEALRMPCWHCFIMCTDTWRNRNRMYDCRSWTSRVHSTPSSHTWCWKNWWRWMSTHTSLGGSSPS